MSPGGYQQRADNYWVWCFSQYVHLPQNANLLRVGVLLDEGTWCGLSFSPHHHRCNGASCDGALMSLLECSRVYATIDSVLQPYIPILTWTCSVVQSILLLFLYCCFRTSTNVVSTLQRLSQHTDQPRLLDNVSFLDFGLDGLRWQRPILVQTQRKNGESTKH